MKEAFDTQIKINEDKLNLSLDEKQRHTKETVLSLISEITEVLSEINWATYKQNKEVIQTNVIEEIVDIFKFTLNLAVIWGYNPESFMEEFRRKSLVVEQRFIQSKILNRIRNNIITKICAIDLDGVIVDYPKCFVDFVNDNTKYSFKNYREMKATLSAIEYLDVKNNYRESGAKKTLPIRKGAKGMIKYLKNKGYTIIILSKRPYKKYYRIFADTKHNLDSNNIAFDALLFDSQKHKRILTEIPQLDFIIEDDRIIANEISATGYKCFLVDNEFNQGSIGENVIRVKEFYEIERELNEKN